MQQKNNAFGNDLIRAAGFPIQAAEFFCMPRNAPQRSAAEPTGLCRQSALYYASFCEKVDRAFVTPLDRRDLLEIASGFHRLTKRLSLLFLPASPEAAPHLLGMCRALQAALAHWQPLGCKTDSMRPYLQKARDHAAEGISAVAAQNLLPRGSAAAWTREIAAHIRLEACFQCGDDLADLIRRVQIQNG